MLDVISVSPPDTNGIVTIHATQETVRIAVDWPLLPAPDPAGTDTQTIGDWLFPIKGKCPNHPPCPHMGYTHDIEAEGDPLPMCCIDGCHCGHPPAGYRRAVPMHVWRDGETVPAGQAVIDLAGQLQPPDLEVNGRDWVNTRGPVVAIERKER